MINIPHTLPEEMSAILFFGDHLENSQILNGQESFKCVRCNEQMVKISYLYQMRVSRSTIRIKP